MFNGLHLLLVALAYLAGLASGYWLGKAPSRTSPVTQSVLDSDEWLAFANRKVDEGFKPIEVPLNGTTVILRNEYEAAAYYEHYAFDELNPDPEWCY